MASFKAYLHRFYSEVILLGILFLFFIQLLTDLVGSIFALNLLTVSLNAYVVIIFFLLLSIILVFFKKIPVILPAILGSFVIVCRLIESLLLFPVVKAIIAGIGCGSFVVFLPAYLWKKTIKPNINAEKTALNLGIGFTLSIVVSILFRTLGGTVDITLFGWYQVIAWFLGIIGLVMLLNLYNNYSQKLSKPEASEMKEKSEAVNHQENDTQTIEKSSNFWKILGLSFGLVGLLAIAYFFLASPAVLSRWVGGNYLSLILLISFLAAVFIILSLLVPDFMNYLKPWILWVWNGLFILSFTFMQVAYQPQYTALRQILFYLMVILSPILFIDFTLLSKELLKRKPLLRTLGVTFTTSFLFVIVAIFGAIFTIAYDYIPIIGPFFRDKHWFVMLCIVISGTAPILLVKDNTIQFKPPISRKTTRKKIVASLVGLIFLGTMISGIITLPFASPPPSTPSTLRFVTFNVQQGYDMNGNLNFSGILYDLQQIDADVIGLQESDTCRISSGNNDLVRFLAQKLHLYSYFGPKTVTGTFGIALLSKYPLSNTKTYYMYSEGEQAATIEAQIIIQSETYNLFVTHFGELENDKEKQAEKIVELTAGKSNVLLLGDFNFEPWSLQYNITTAVLVDAWSDIWPSGIDDTGYNGFTFNWANPHSRIDYIFVSSDISLIDCRVITEAHSSDHMPVIVSIQI
ncbi:MAG: hypothetical protein GF308_03000 [Candidatus Heimdallarchaeota archaeon]|nr:hypothetical protein [Candidatus Heimdallarchaeota archaeon]